ncbi:MAG TPA: arginine deiminase family protein, partial [Caballeronia sp.]|nr:arginine deiminase family protein [Caballeronia sp.]
MALGVHSEAGKLRTVMVCRPGLAHRRLTPANAASLLFDDVIWVDKAIEDHDVFTGAMRERGIEVLEFHDLLAAICGDPIARDWILDRRIVEEEVGTGMLKELRAWLE